MPIHYSAVLLLLLLSAAAAAADVNVVQLGARGDGGSDSTAAFLKAWGLACYGSGGRPATIHVPRGRYVIRPVSLSGPCRSQVTVLMDRGATLLAPADYKWLHKSEFWILFYRVNGVKVIGGSIDARGAAFWSCRRHGHCSGGARSLTFEFCTNVEVRGLTSLYSQRVHIAIGDSKNVLLTKLTIRAPSGSPNTDGVHISSSSHVTVTASVIHTGDDCISIGQGTNNVKIDRIACGPGHGISIGSLGNSLHEGGVENVTVSGVILWRTQNGVRIKSWARPTTSYVKNVVFRNIVMNNVYNPIIIDQRYCPNNQCPHSSSGVRISGVKYRNIRGTSASKVAMTFDCSPSNPCKGIRLHDIKLTYMRKPAFSSCKNAHGSSRGIVIPGACW